MIRPFSFADLEFILQIETHSFPKSPYDWATFLNLYALYPETFLVYVDTGHGQKGEEILGYIVFSQDGHILSIAVLPQHRRKGIGRQLLQSVRVTPALKKVWAEVRRSNRGAQAFYSKMGFQRIGTVPNYYGNEDALIIQWTPAACKSC
ncbi:MAG TPA: N-acetyltransferase [Thermodesulfobacteriota bacterium]|nr:N-acetyltransferase [Thermodesulfobacteriota bacterium]